MAENAYDVLKEVSPALVGMLDANHNVCEFLIAFYKHIEEVANTSPKDPANIICAVNIVNERLLKISTHYYEPGSNNTATDRHPSKRNMNIVNLFQVNHNIRDVAIRVVEILERWMNEKPERKQQGWENIVLSNGVHWKDHTFTVELQTRFEFDEYVTTKMKWPGIGSEPEQPTIEDEATNEVAKIDLEGIPRIN